MKRKIRINRRGSAKFATIETTPAAASAPLGLRALISALQPGDCTARYAIDKAQAVAGAPRAILEAQAADSESYRDVLFAMTDRAFPGRNVADDGDGRAQFSRELVADTSFWAGVATAWHLMNAINGQDGAR